MIPATVAAKKIDVPPLFSFPALLQPANNPQPTNSQLATFQSIFCSLRQFILLSMLKNSLEGNPALFAFHGLAIVRTNGRPDKYFLRRPRFSRFSAGASKNAPKIWKQRVSHIEDGRLLPGGNDLQRPSRR